MTGPTIEDYLLPHERRRAEEEDLSKVRFSARDRAIARSVCERVMRERPSQQGGLVQKALAARNAPPGERVVMKEARSDATQTGFRFFPNWRLS